MASLYRTRIPVAKLPLSPSLRDDIRALTGVTATPGTSSGRVTSTEQREGYRVDTIALQGEGGEVTGLIAVPPSSGRKAAVLMVGAAADDFDRLAKSGRVVMVLEPRPSPPGTEGVKSPYLGTFNLLSLRAFLVGKTIVGMRAEDTLHAVDWLSARADVDASAITAYGNGPMGPVVLHAAALDSRIRSVIVENTLTSYRMILEQPLHRNVSEVLIPGVLRKYDMGDLLLAISPRPVTVINPQDATGAVITGEQFRNQLNYIYRAGTKIELLSRGSGDPLPIK